MVMIRKNKTKKQLEKFHNNFHLTAITGGIEGSIHYPDKKTSNIKYSYKEKKHSKPLKGHDKLTDSRVIEATSLKEAQQLFYDEIKLEQEYEEYSSSAHVDVDNVQFIDGPVVSFQIRS